MVLSLHAIKHPRINSYELFYLRKPYRSLHVNCLHIVTYYWTSFTPLPYSFLLDDYNTPSQFQEVADILEPRRVRYVIWDTTIASRLNLQLLPEAQPKSTGDKILDPYIESHYKIVENDRGVRIMVRMDARPTGSSR
jgi:hypothetical protein